MIKLVRGKGAWIGAGVAALLVVIVLFSTQAFSSSLTVTSEPLQNTGADGVIKYDQNWSAASAVVTRHESSVLTVDVSDQITDVTVKGIKAAGAVNVKVDLLDVSQTILDSKTVVLDTGAGAYNQLVDLPGTTKLVGVARVLATYTATSIPIAFDAVSSTNGKTTSLSWSHTVGAGGANRILIVGVSFKNTSSVTGVTYGGEALTLVPNSGQSTTGRRVELWYKVAPLENTNTVVVTMPSSIHTIAGATSWTEVHQTTPLGAAATFTATSTTPSVSVLSGSGDVVVDTMVAPSSPTVDGSQTHRWSLPQGGTYGAGSSENGGASSTTMSWTTGAVEWGITGVALKQALP